MTLLREFIANVLDKSAPGVKAPKSKKVRTAVLVGPSSADLSLALQWLHINKRLKDASEIMEREHLRYVKIRYKGTFDELEYMVRSKFGVFIKVLE